MEENNLQSNFQEPQTSIDLINLENVTLSVRKEKECFNRIVFESQFNYCLLVWMFCRRCLNHRINKLHE